MFLQALKSQFLRPLVGTAIATSLYSSQKIYCSPTFEGVPVSATLLIHQSIPYFEKKFPGLEVSGVYSPGEPGHTYVESGKILGLYPTKCTVTIPIYEKLSKEEEERLGKAMIKKDAVAHLILHGECKVGCATATLSSIRIYKLDANQNTDLSALVWSWNKEER
jgi:hypothetical protein